MKLLRCSSAAAAWILGTGLAPAQSEIPHPAPDTPAPQLSDPDETGGLLHILPGRTDPLTLPSESPPNSGSLFPPQLWPATPPLPAESANPSTPDPTPASTISGNTDDSPSPWNRDRYVADPFGTLGSITRAHLESLLAGATGTSGTPVHCLVLPESMRLPEAWDPAPWLRNTYGDRAAVAAVLPIGAPGQTQLHPSEAAAARWNPPQLTVSVAACAAAASAVTGPDAVASRFLLHLTRELNTPRPPEPGPQAPLLSPNTGSARWWLAAVIGQFLAIGLGALWWHARQRRQAARTPLVLSVLPSTPRLGAPYSGGHSASVRFRPAKPSV